MAKLQLRFAVEDFITTATDDAVKRIAQILTKHKLRGSFHIVAEKARALKARGRQDVIDALREHEIGYHSNTHSIHPVIAEYLEELDWDHGLDRFISEEIRGIQELSDILGVRPSYFCGAGNGDWGPQAFYALQSNGISVGSSPLGKVCEVPVWYCNFLHLDPSSLNIENRLFQEDGLDKLKATVADLYQGQDAVVSIGAHPCRFVTQTFWDKLNFFTPQGTNPERRAWQEAPLWPADYSEKLFADFETFTRFLANDLQTETVGFTEVLASFQDHRGSWCDLGTIIDLATRVGKRIDYQVLDNNVSFSAAEVLSLLVEALSGFIAAGTLPGQVSLRQPIGPVSEMADLDNALTIKSNSLFRACSTIGRDIMGSGRIPAKIELCGAQVGPGDLLRVTSDMVRHIHQRGTAPSVIAVRPGSNYPEISGAAEFNNAKRYCNPRFPSGFTGEKLRQLIRLQSWSFRPAVSSSGIDNHNTWT